MSGNGVPLIAVSQVTPVYCAGCTRRGRRMVHFERVAERAIILNKRNGHEFFITSRQVRFTDNGVEVTGGMILTVCRQCGTTTETVLDAS